MVETFERWTRDGLVTPTLWVTPADVVIAPPAPPTSSAWIVTPDGVRKVDDLFRYVASHRMDLVRIVAAQLATLAAVEPDRDLVTVARALGESIHHSLPRSHQSDGLTTRLSRVNVIAPVSGANGLSDAFLIPSWDVNVLVSPEDRPDANLANIFVREPGNAIGHLCTALACVGGCFSGVDGGVFDQLDPGQSNVGNRDLTVLRCAVRGVIGTDAETSLALKSIDAVSADSHGFIDFVNWGRAAQNPQLLSEQVYRFLLSQPPWAPQPLITQRSAEMEKRRVSQAADDAWRFNLHMFGAVPRWVFLDKKTQFEDIATGALLGEDGGAVVRLNPKAPQAMQASAAQLLARADAQNRRAELAQQGSAVAAIDPDTWSALRNVAFSMADGGPLPTGLPEPLFAGEREVLAPSYIAPDPAKVFQHDDRVVGVADLAGQKQMVESLNRPAASSEPVVDGSVPVVDPPVVGSEPVVELVETTGSSATVAEPGPAGGFGPAETVGLNRPAEHATAQEPVVEAGPLATALETTGSTSTAAELKRFASWRAGFSQSVLYRLLANVTERSEQLRQEFEVGLAAEEIPVPSTDALVAAQKRLFRWWGGTLLTWLITTVLTWLIVSDQIQLPERAQTWFHDNGVWLLFGLLLTALLTIITANHRFYKADRNYRWIVHRQLVARTQAAERVVWCGQESGRLAQLANSLADWMQTIGWVLHHPTGEVTDPSHNIDEQVVETLPASFALAKSLDNQSPAKNAVLKSVRMLYPQGWATRAFDHAYRQFAEDDLDSERVGTIAPDLDQGSSRYGPRQELLEYWANGSAGSYLTSEYIDRLKLAVREHEFAMPPRQVIRLGEYGTGRVIAEPEFFAAVAADSPVFALDGFSDGGASGGQKVERSAVWLPETVTDPVAGENVIVARADQSVAVRADISHRLTPDRLSAFGADAPTQPQVEAPFDSTLQPMATGITPEDPGTFAWV